VSTAVPSPLPLALVITELDVGGAEQALVHLATGLSRARFAPTVYSLQARPENDLLVQRLEEAQVPVHFLNLRSRWQFFGAVSKLAALFRQQQARIVQSFLFHANVVATLAARQAKVPGMVTGVRVADPSPWRQRVERWLTPKVDKIVCVSQGVAEFCQHKCGFPADKLAVIPNGVDLSRFSGATPADLQALGVPAGRRAILFIGRLDKQKGLDWLFSEVLPKVFAELPQHDLLLAGDGSQRQELESLASQLRITERVHFAGRQRTIPEILAASDLLVLPSRWEGMPNVLLEAMAAGKPLVATRVEGIEELLGKERDEQSCKAGDAPAFADKIVALARDRSIAERLGPQNQQRAAAEFTLVAMIARYEALYESLAAKIR